MMVLTIYSTLRGTSSHISSLKGAQEISVKSTASKSRPSERMQRVESRLLPPVLIKGQPVIGMRLADRMQFHKTPGVSVAVINRGVIEWARGYGVRGAQAATPVTVETLFQAGSISKAVSATAALRLVQLGKLNLDEDVNRKLVSWKVPESQLTRESKVTLRRLLSHGAGLTVHGFPGYAASEQIPTLLQVLEGVKPANTEPVRVDTIPGSKYRYSGGGFTVMQQLLVDVTGKPFTKVMREVLLDRIRLKNSTFQQPLPKDLWAQAAIGHQSDGTPIKGNWHIYPEMAAAGLWSTATDLARIAIEIQRSKAGTSNRVLSVEMVSQMLSPQLAEDQGLGWELASSGRSARYYHGGDTAGYKCVMVAYINSGQGAVVMTNSDKGEELADEILRSIAKEYDWPDYLPKEKTVAHVDPKVYAAYVGQYALEIAPNILVNISAEDGKFFIEVIQPTGRQKDELLPESETQFFHKESDFQVTFTKGQNGQATHLVIRQKREEFSAKRIK